MRGRSAAGMLPAESQMRIRHLSGHLQRHAAPGPPPPPPGKALRRMLRAPGGADPGPPARSTGERRRSPPPRAGEGVRLQQSTVSATSSSSSKAAARAAAAGRSAGSRPPARRAGPPRAVRMSTSWPRSAVRRRLLHEQLGRAAHRGQRVADFVRQLGGERAQRGQPVRAPQLLLGAAQLGQVLEDDQERRPPSPISSGVTVSPRMRSPAGVCTVSSARGARCASSPGRRACSSSRCVPGGGRRLRARGCAAPARFT